jgi:rhodanese-related sulfurtransferase
MGIFQAIKKWIPLGKVEEISAQQLWAKIQQDGAEDNPGKSAEKCVQILDVRSQLEWNTSAIQGSKNLPITQFSQQNIQGLNLDPELPVVAICLSAHRSIPAVRQLKQMGYKQVMQLQGGMKSWWKQKLPVVKN